MGNYSYCFIYKPDLYTEISLYKDEYTDEYYWYTDTTTISLEHRKQKNKKIKFM